MLALFKAARNRSTRDWAMILLVYRHDLRASEVFIHEFNHERPHEALAMKCPVEVYKPSARPYQGIGELSFPLHDRTVLVTYCGRICIFKKKINLSTSLSGQAVGIKEVDDGIWLVSFMDYDLGYIDLEEKTLQPLENPFGPKV